VARAIARYTGPAPEEVARALTWGADEKVLLILAAAGWVASRGSSEPLQRAGNHAVLVAVVASLLPHGLKLLFDQTRPDRLTVLGHVHGISFSGKREDAFPSGHALHMGALASAAGALPAGPRRAARALAVGLSLTRVVVLAHWASVSNLDNVFWRKWLETSLFALPSNPPIRIDLWPSRLIELSGIGVIAFEIGFLFVVLFRRLRVPAAFAGLGFHIGNGLILQIWFTTLIPAYVALIDWCALGRWMCGARNRPITVLYDGQCRFCRRTIAQQRLRIDHRARPCGQNPGVEAVTRIGRFVPVR